MKYADLLKSMVALIPDDFKCDADCGDCAFMAAVFTSMIIVMMMYALLSGWVIT